MPRRKSQTNRRAPFSATLSGEPPREIARKVATRTTAHRFVADSLSKTSDDLVLTGSSAAEVIDAGLTRETRKVEGHLPDGTLEDFVRRHLLTLDSDGDVTIYEAPALDQLRGRYAPSAVIAADLARSVVTRERSAGLAALEDLRQAWLARHTR